MGSGLVTIDGRCASILTGWFHAGTADTAESLSCFMSLYYKVERSCREIDVVEGE